MAFTAKRISPDVYVSVDAPAHKIRAQGGRSIIDGYGEQYDVVVLASLPYEQVSVIGYGKHGMAEEDVHHAIENAFNVDRKLSGPLLATRIVKKFKAL